MKNRFLKLIVIVAISSTVFTACNGLKKMVKRANEINYVVTPNPLEMHADSVKFSLVATYPAKYFNKKATISAIPVLVYEGGEKNFKTIDLKGEKAEGNGQVVGYAEGGKITYEDKIPYQKGMEKAKLEMRATAKVKSKSAEFGKVTIAEGTNITPLLVKKDEKPITADHNYVKSTEKKQANIYFLKDKYDVRDIEKKSDDMQKLNKDVDKAIAEKSEIKGITINGYASPEGEIYRNENLATNRAISTMKYLQTALSKKLPAAKEATFYATAGKGEDWEKFNELISQSSIRDKEQASSIQGRYNSPEQREQELRNLTSFAELERTVFPKIRRSEIILNIVGKESSPEELKSIALATPEKLDNNQLLYAASVATDNNETKNILAATQRQYPRDWRAYNNMGVVYFNNHDMTNADSEFQKALRLSPSNNTVLANLALLEQKQGNYKEALKYYEKTGEIGNYNKGTLYIKTGQYNKAVAQFGNICSFNAALAKVLNKTYDDALTTLKCSEEKDSALGYYLQAIIYARKADETLMINSLKAAIAKDTVYKQKAKNDVEFIQYRDNETFKSIVE